MGLVWMEMLMDNLAERYRKFFDKPEPIPDIERLHPADLVGTFARYKWDDAAGVDRKQETFLQNPLCGPFLKKFPVFFWRFIPVIDENIQNILYLRVLLSQEGCFNKQKPIPTFN